MYGYEITSALQEIPVFHIPNGSIYPILNRITKTIGLFPIGKSLVMAQKEKKYYRITDEGREILHNRLHDYDAVYQALMLLAKGEDKNEQRTILLQMNS